MNETELFMKINAGGTDSNQVINDIKDSVWGMYNLQHDNGGKFVIQTLTARDNQVNLVLRVSAIPSLLNAVVEEFKNHYSVIDYTTARFA